MVATMTSSDFPWPVTDPYIVERTAGDADIDEFGHVNNVRYIDWAMALAWAHSQSVGMPFAAYEKLGAGFVVWRHEFDYLRPLLPGETAAIATWIAENDQRVRIVRGFEFRRIDDGEPLLRGRTRMVSVDLASGKPMRMPPAFVEAYPAATLRT